MKLTMRRKIVQIITLLMFCTILFQPTVFANEEVINVTVDNIKLGFDQSPVIENGRTLVPLRKIFESLNAFVEWDEQTQSVYAKKGATNISLTVGSNIAKVNSKEYILDVPAKIVNSRTLVPARFVAESLNCKVEWNGDTSTVIIKSAAHTSDEKNRYNVDGVTYGYYLHIDGKLRVNNDYNVTDYMGVTPGETLYFTDSRIAVQVRYVTAYDANKNVVRDAGAESVKQYTVPEGIHYIRATLYAANTPYLKMCNEIKTDGFINNEICVASGKTVTIYSSQLISEKRDDLVFAWECAVGREENGNYVIEATDNYGEYPLTVTATDRNGNVVWTGNTTIKIVKNTVEKIKLLALGDSLTNNKPWMKIMDLSSNGNIEFVGTRGTPYKHEGRSGFTSQGYISATEYTFEKEGIHPFWDGERFNWNYYKEKTNIQPDAVQIFLGINAIQNNPYKNASSILNIIDYIRNDQPDIPIFVINTMYKGALSDKAEHLKVFNLTEKLSTSLKNYDNVYVVPVAITFDSENNYSEKDQIHPMDIGYEEIADVIYSSMCAHLK